MRLIILLDLKKWKYYNDAMKIVRSIEDLSKIRLKHEYELEMFDV